MSKKTRILFVCTGNIIRSPLAEHMFRSLAEKSGVADNYEIDSAGTSGYHVGEHPDSRMRKVAAANGLEYDGESRRLKSGDLDKFDLLIGMDGYNYSSMRSMTRSPGQEDKIRLLREFDPQGTPSSSVPDPYYGGIDGFHEVYRVVERSCQGLLEALESGGVKLQP